MSTVSSSSQPPQPPATALTCGCIRGEHLCERAQTQISTLYKGLDMTRAEIVRTKRDNLGWTQRQTAEALGVTVTTVTNWESGRTQPQDVFITLLQLLIEKKEQESVNAA